MKDQLLKFAESDLNLARRHGEICVYQTKKGNVDVSCKKGIYTILGTQVVDWKTGRVDSWELKGTKRVIREALANIYVVAA